jgi:ribitol 2-dehydrogenase
VDSLTDKVAIITGASSGIGRSYARALAVEGARVVLVGRDTGRLDAVARSLPTDHLVLAGDVSSADFDRRVVKSTLERFGTVDILLSNAGLYLAGDFAEANLEEVQTLLAVNVFGAIAIAREVLPHMLAAGTGDIIMTSSVSGHQAIHWEPVYSASKHAVQAFVHTVRRQLIGTGVRLGEVAPGVVLNELWGIDEDDDNTPRLENGTGIRSEDVAESVLFMLTRPRRVTIRDLVILPTSQEI